LKPALLISGTPGEKFPKRRISGHIRAHLPRRAAVAPFTISCKLLGSCSEYVRSWRNCHAEGRGFESLQPLFRERPAQGRVGFDELLREGKRVVVTIAEAQERSRLSNRDRSEKGIVQIDLAGLA
jgi:hypothetical protein